MIFPNVDVSATGDVRPSSSAPLTSSQLILLRPDGTTPGNYDNLVTARCDRHTRIPPADFHRALERALRAQAAYRLRFGALTAQFDDDPAASVAQVVSADPDDVAAQLYGLSVDLARGPLVLCALGLDGDLVHSFALSVPHVVLDGVTQELLLTSLARAAAGQHVETCSEPQYRQYVAAALRSEEAALAGYRGRRDDLLRQWDDDRAHLGPPFGLGAPDHRPPRRAVRTLGTESTAALARCAQARGVRVLDLVLAAYGSWLSRRTGHDRHLCRLVVGVRDRDVPPFAGCLVNTGPLVLDSPADDGGRDAVVAGVAERKRTALRRRFLPYVDLCQHLLAQDEKAIELLDGSTMVTFRRVRELTGPGGERFAEVDHTLPPKWPRAPVLLRVLTHDGGVTLDVETDHRLPDAFHAQQVAAGLVDRLASLAATDRGRP
jgi:hypothetical protein